MLYIYWISRGIASLHKMHDNGNDTDKALVKIGRFKTDEQAKDACMKHYCKACSMVRAAGRKEPKIKFM